MSALKAFQCNNSSELAFQGNKRGIRSQGRVNNDGFFKEKLRIIKIDNENIADHSSSGILYIFHLHLYRLYVGQGMLRVKLRESFGNC